MSISPFLAGAQRDSQISAPDFVFLSTVYHRAWSHLSEKGNSDYRSSYTQLPLILNSLSSLSDHS